MDRESASDTGDLAGTAHTVKRSVTRDGEWSSGSPAGSPFFVLVYEKESSGAAAAPEAAGRGRQPAHP